MKAVLVAAIVASGMSYIDGTALTVALPVIKAQLPANDAQAQWVIEGYLLFLSALILIGGALGDRYGRRTLFEIGTSAFAIASIACGLARDPSFLIIARCVQGIGAALMIPESLALITACYAPGERGRAIGMWASASALTAAAGPVVGGWLTQAFSWRAVFWINVPLAIAVLVISRSGIPESRASNVRGVPDVLGSTCVTVALGCIVFSLIELQATHRNPLWLPLLVFGTVMLGCFALVERRASAPVAPPRLFASAAFSIANLYTLLLYAALGGALFFVPFQLQHVMGYSPLDAGLSLLPTIGLIALGSPLSGSLVPRTGTRLPLALGAAIAAISFAAFARLTPGAPYVTSVLPATLLLGLGLAIAVAPLTTAVMGAADTDDVGAASGINNSISRIGNLVAIAILGIVVAASGGGALPTASHPQGFVDAMLAAAAMALAAACTTLFLPRRASAQRGANR